MKSPHSLRKNGSRYVGVPIPPLPIVCRLTIAAACFPIVSIGPAPVRATEVPARTAPSIPKEARMFLRDGMSLMRVNHNQEACDKLQQAAALCPASAEIQHSLALVLAKLGRMPEAIAAMKKAVELSPDSEASLLTLGGFYQANGDVAEAINTYNEFLSRFPDNRMKRKVEGLRQALDSEQRESQNRADQQRLLTGTDNHPGASTERSIVAPLSSEFSQDGKDDYLAQVTASGAQRWDQGRIPITVYIRDGGNITGFRTSFVQILKRSFDDWANASEGGVAFKFVDSAREARLQCVWTDQITKLANPAEAGDARMIMDQDGICQGELWLLTRPVSGTTPLTDNFFRLVCLHEIGHALGLSGHTSNPGDVMFFSATFKDCWRELSGRDRRTIKRFYTDR